MQLELDGKTALVTGASQGIGEGIAKEFAAEGVNLHLTARNVTNLERIKMEIESSSSVTVTLHPLDITQSGACSELSEQVGDIDILVNNAGAIPSGNLFDIDEATWRQGWELKVMGYINMCRIFYSKMKAKSGGVIINNIGSGGEVFDSEYIAGTAGNAGLMAFTRALGGSSLKDGIRVMGVNPGPVKTERIVNMLKKRASTVLGDESRYLELVNSFPLGRPAHVREVTSLIVFLASHRAGYSTGSIYTVDGGISSRQSIA
ncbi:SDR family oxidoreductase [Sneathiella marina]|uniref:SDR family oxidoreductase n=1 Tax=Sneathiella marina TaxID=2950108 RepID=A0ABY4W0T5_9PROT|nr:SDR family oxidoreductase [Sneathiella marina]USG60822.1 SDR family oxidoreductase [Sneathiella marina]